MTPQQHVRVGVGVFILQSPFPATNPIFLIGKRKGSHGAGTYALPGGHLEMNETPEECAEREVLEETGLRVKDVKFLTATNDVMIDEGKHYVTLFMVCTRSDESAEAEVLEPEKCEGWEWCEWEELLKGIQVDDGKGYFLPLVNLLRQRAGVVPQV